MEAQIIRGETRLVGLLGNPVAHSLSPQIHNHAFSVLNIPLAYVPLSVRDDALHSAMAALHAFAFAGANVTIPYKQRVLPYCDILSPMSTMTGSVNTLYFDKGLLHILHYWMMMISGCLRSWKIKLLFWKAILIVYC